jgi:histidinol-phosphatase (PHP family)
MTKRLWTANWHTHTARCKHASGSVADYCAAAVAQGLADLGISDHPPFADGRWQSVRMDISEA